MYAHTFFFIFIFDEQKRFLQIEKKSRTYMYITYQTFLFESILTLKQRDINSYVNFMDMLLNRF